MNNKIMKTFLLRGALFGGLGPIIAGLIYLILSYTIKDFSLTGLDIFIAILSTYILAFVSAGSSVFNQIEHWPLLKSLSVHMSILLITYLSCYLINSWIPFDWTIIGIFIGIFIGGYLFIYFLIYFIVKITSKKLNKDLRKFLK